MTAPKLLPRYTLDQYTNFLAQFEVSGQLTSANFCEGEVLRKFIECVSPEAKRIGDLSSTAIEDLDPRFTDNFIEEWESALGLPDECIPIASTIQERRDNIVLKLASLAVNTEDDYINLGAQFGLTITIRYYGPGEIGLPYTLPFPLTKYSTLLTVIFVGDYASDPEASAIFQCLVKKLIPATRRVLFEQSP